MDQPFPEGAAGDLRSLVDRFVAAQVDGDRNVALRVVLDEGLGRGLPVPDLYLRVIEPAQHRIGRLWQENRITVAEEHLATAIAQLAIAQLYPHLPRAPRNGKLVLIGCVEGELHDLGARVTADFFEMAGFDVRYLGPNVPAAALIALVRESRPDLLVLSATMSLDAGLLRDAVLRTRDAGGDQMRQAVGGRSISLLPALTRGLPIEVTDGNAARMVEEARRALGLPEVP